MKIFKANMDVIQNTIDTENLPSFKRLLTEEYWKISDDQFDRVIEETLDDVKEGKIVLIDIVKLFAYFSYFSKKGLISHDIKTLKNDFFTGMNLSALTSKYCENPEEELGKVAIEEIEDDLDDILKHFYTLNEQLLDKMYKEKAEDLFKSIPMRMEEFYEKFDRDFMETPIFKYYDVYQLFQRISCASNEDIVLIKEKLVNRADKHKDKIEPEMKNMKQLKRIIDDYVKEKDTTIKIVMLKDLSKGLGYILDKYKTGFLGKKEEKEEITEEGE